MTQKDFEDSLKLAQLRSADNVSIMSIVLRIAYSGNQHFIYDLIEYCPGVDTPEYMKVLEDAILGLATYKNNILIAYEFMYEMATDFEIKNFNLEGFEKFIIASGNPKYMSYCILCIKGTNVPRMLKALYETKSEKYLERIKDKYDHSVNKDTYPYFTIFNDAYDKELEASSKIIYVPAWMYALKTSHPYSMTRAVINSENPYFINELADYFEYFIKYVLKKEDYQSIDYYEKLILSLNEAIKIYGYMLDKYEYSWSIERCNKKEMQQDVIEAEDAKFMYYFRDIPGANIEELDEAIKRSDNTKYINLINSTNLKREL